MPGKDHVHKVRKQKLGKQGKFIVYACVLPDCTFYLQLKLYIGKMTICWGCGSEFRLLGFPSDMPEKPRCNKCKRNKKPAFIEEKAVDKVIEKVVTDDIDWNSLIPKVPKV